MLPLADLFQDYAPPNAPITIRRRWCRQNLARLTAVWAIAYNTELIKDPPKTWMDLTKPNMTS